MRKMWTPLFAGLLITVSLFIASNEGRVSRRVSGVSGPDAEQMLEENDHLLPNFEDARNEEAPDNRKAAVVNKVRIGTNSRPSLPASRRHQGTTSASTTKDYKTLDASRKTHTNYNMEEKVPLIYATTNKNRAGWLMPDESIPE